jgi:uncharacterized tellurite resistance protein B-like protein
VKSILSFLGIGRDDTDEPAGGDTETVRKIVRELEALPPERARWVASFAYILSRVAHADLEISAEETRKMEEIVRRSSQLPEEQAVLVVQIAKSQARLFGGTENFQVTREFERLSTRDERLELLDCLFAVSAADESISGVEEAAVRQIAEELGFNHREYIEIRTRYNDRRSVIQRLATEPS